MRGSPQGGPFIFSPGLFRILSRFKATLNETASQVAKAHKYAQRPLKTRKRPGLTVSAKIQADAEHRNQTPATKLQHAENVHKSEKPRIAKTETNTKRSLHPKKHFYTGNTFFSVFI